MTIKNDLYVYRVRHGSTRIRKYKLSKFIANVNDTLFTKKFFINNEAVVEEHIIMETL